MEQMVAAGGDKCRDGSWRVGESWEMGASGAEEEAGWLTWRGIVGAGAGVAEVGAVWESWRWGEGRRGCQISIYH